MPHTSLVDNTADDLRDSEEQKQRFQADPDYYLKYRKMVELQMSQGFVAYHKGTDQQKNLLEVSINSAICS